MRSLFLLIACQTFLAAQVITTIAGTDWTFPSGPLPALSAPLATCTGVALDASGNVLVTDNANHMVMRIAADGSLTVIAGNGIPGFAGDGGPATSASLNYPYGIAVDAAGNLFIADEGNLRIRKVTPSGIITTVAGNGEYSFSGDGGPATSAAINNPTGVAVDAAGNLYIADSANNRVRKVDTSGIITTFAGSSSTFGFSGDGGPATSASLAAPQAVAVDSAGNIYIADFFNGRVRKVSAGIITTVAGGGTGGDGGPATSAAILPWGVAVDKANNLYIIGVGIRKVSGGIISTVASGVGSWSAAIDPGGNIYTQSGSASQYVVVVAPNGNATTIAGNGRYRFSGDGGPATSAALNLVQSQTGLAVDATGSVFVADKNNNRVRKISGGTITTVVGNGVSGFTGDGGPATAASIAAPSGLATDAAGNLYIADGNGHIRKVTAGSITTIASPGSPGGLTVDLTGNLYFSNGETQVEKLSNGSTTLVAGSGTQGFSGDGGAATGATFLGIFGLAADPHATLYITDFNNQRIRSVSQGIIATFAGNGKAAWSGDGGPATSASLFSPIDVATDSTGAVYIADFDNRRIRKVSAGTITTVAGSAGVGYSGDGGLATNATFSLPSGVAVDSQGNIYIADAFDNRIREVLATPPYFPAPSATGTIQLTAAANGSKATTNLNVTAAINQQSSVLLPGMAYTASVANGAPWLSVSPQSGSTPGLLTVIADPFNLNPGSYTGTISIAIPLANPTVQTVAVQFTVTQGIPAKLTIDQKQLSFTYSTTSSPRNQTIVLSNSGGGSLNFTASVTLNSGQSANWLSLTPEAGTATPGNPISIAVLADPSSLSPGTYTGSINIQGGTAGIATLPVVMTITSNPHVLLLSQTGLTFTAIQNGGAIPPQTFGVINLGSGLMSWNVQTSTLAGGDWLNANPPSGSSGVSSASLITISVNLAGLQPNIYYGLVKVISAGAANTPQEVVVVLRVLRPNTDLGPIVLPSSLIFTSQPGVSSPSSQNLLVYDPTGTGKSFRSAITTSAGGSWLVTLPGDGTIPAGQPAPIVVQPIVNGLVTGVHAATLTLEFSDGRVTAIPITFVVTATGVSANERPRATQTCTPTKLLPALASLSTGFNVPASFPQQLIAQIVDDCGTPLTQGKVSVEFSTGEPIQYMDSLSNGRWDLTWQTASQAVAGVTLTVRAEHPTLPISGTVQITGGLGATQPPPMVLGNGVVSAASGIATPAAPGGMVSIYGSSLSDAAAPAPVLPLPVSFNNTTVTLGDYTLPLFYTSTGQVNALIPYEVNTNTSMNLLVQRESTYANVVRLNIAAAQPEIFQYGQQQGIAVNLAGALNSPSNPAHAGDVLIVYCAGLGAVAPPVPDGAAAPPAGPVSYTQNPVTVTIGGQNANVGFAGLTPGLAGLYQINLTVPQGVTPGDQVPVLVSTAGQTGSVVYFSVR